MSLLAASVATVALMQGSQSHVLTGSVTYRERIALSPNAEVTIALDMIDGDETIRLSSVRMLLSGKQVPINYSLPYTINAAHRKNKFVVRATLRDSEYGFWGSPTGRAVAPGSKMKHDLLLVRGAGAPGWAKLNWKLVAIQGQVIKADRYPTLAFDWAKGDIRGHSGVNGFGGKFMWEQPSLQIDPGAMTLMAGSEEQMEIENNYLRLLPQVNRIRMTVHGMSLDRNDRELLRFVAAP